ncbi:MAG: purine-nucleoside phosphorylase [Anaerolineaceae bacterium]|nr:purine-nucleoside phosphorylase [Anaerolineaceae bacterium]
MDYPILEFDSSREAIIEPHHLISRIDLPQQCVLCFFNEVIGQVDASETIRTEIVHHIGSEIGKVPVYVVDYQGQPCTVVHPGVGAPLAAAFLEEMIALGCTKFIACGGAGVLNGDLVVGHLVVPTSAVRDEGTSYHYLPAGREVGPSPEGIAAIEATLSAHQAPYVTGKTWTTDAIYRETPARMARRRNEGCLTVEMEAAAFFAVAQFRGVTFAQILYSGDDLSGPEWGSRNWGKQTSTRQNLFWLSVEAALRL